MYSCIDKLCAVPMMSVGLLLLVNNNGQSNNQSVCIRQSKCFVRHFIEFQCVITYIHLK